MSFIQEIKDARNGKTVPLTYFLSDGDMSNKNVCYGFVEGKDDPSFYRTKIKQYIPEEGWIKFFPCGGKSTVKYTYERLNERGLLSNKRIIFFIDRDISDIVLDNDLIISDLVYITDYYSIENSIVSFTAIIDTLQDVMGFSLLSANDINIIKGLYESQIQVFQSLMLPIMANICYWKRNGINGNYHNYCINKLFSILNGCIHLILSPMEQLQNFYQSSGVDFYENYDSTRVGAELNLIIEKKAESAIIRGKYLSQFFVMFCNSIFSDCNKLKINKSHKGRLLGNNDIMQVTAPRTHTPKSLAEFITSTISQYYQSISKDSILNS